MMSANATPVPEVWKVVTLTQPWATLVALQAKRIETRPKPWQHRGLIGIHAAAGLTPIGGWRGLRQVLASHPAFVEALWPIAGVGRLADSQLMIEAIIAALPFGAVVAVADLRWCMPTQDMVRWGRAVDQHTEWTLTEQERAFGNYAPGRFSYLLANTVQLPDPVPLKGKQGVLHWRPPEAVRQVVIDRWSA